MASGAVETIMGRPSMTESYGPPGEFVLIYSYGPVQVTFDSRERVLDVSR